MTARAILSYLRAPPIGAAALPRPPGELDDMQAQYESAARYPTAYYGQLARARLGSNFSIDELLRAGSKRIFHPNFPTISITMRRR